MKENSKNPLHKEYLLPLLALFIIGAKTWVALQFDVHPDEAYYWEWSRNLDFSYYDQGPGIAFIIRFFTTIFGSTPFALKFAGVLTSVGASFFIYKTALLLGFSRMKSIFVFLLTQIVPGLFGTSLFILHDSALLLFWSMALYFGIQYLKIQSLKSFYVFFICLGLGALSKHTMIFFAFGSVIFAVFDAPSRSLIRNKHLYFAALISLALVSPILYWNITHKWAGVEAIIHLRSAGGLFSDKSSTAEFLAGQFVAMTPFLFIFLIVGLVKVLYSLVKNKLKATELAIDRLTLFLVCNILPILVFFLIMTRSKTVQGNWLFCVYPSVILFVLSLDYTGWKKRVIDVGTPIFAVLLITVAVLIEPISKALHVNIASYHVPLYRTQGFEEAVDYANEIKQKVDPQAAIIANRYQDAAVLSFYSPDQPRSISINIMQKNEYSFWPGLDKGKNYFILFINENACQKSPVFFQIALVNMFDSVKEFPEKEIIIDGKIVKRAVVFYVTNYKRPWDSLLVEYLRDYAILDLMPNIRGNIPFKESPESVAMLKESFKKMYLDKPGQSSKYIDPTQAPIDRTATCD